MPEFHVDFEYTTTLWDRVTVTADNKDEAEEFAMHDIDASFPEARDVVILRIEENDGED